MILNRDLRLLMTLIIVLTILFSLNSALAQEQGLQESSQRSSLPTSGLGISISNSQVQEMINATTLSPNQDRVIIGSFGDDRITGTNDPDIIIGLLGADTIRGGGGGDKIQGNEDVDKLYGEVGNDLIQGGTATDQLYGGEGDDVLSGGMGDNFLVGEQGNDKLYGGPEDDILQGGPGADYFDCGEEIDIIIDFNLGQGDDNAGNCEEISTSPN
jgi:Ca2+-binding RTX toxin-like protein